MFFIALIFFLNNSIILPVTNYQQKLISHVQDCIFRAKKEKSKLNEEILQLEGMSSSKVRHLLNNLCNFDDVRYLEIGTWKGSTFISAMYKNRAQEAIAIDNWSIFLHKGNPKEAFLKSTQKFLSNNNFKFYEANCFNINLSEIFKNKINIYFYDGKHSFESQKLAFTYFNEILDDNFIAIVDDYNLDQVRRGTKLAFKELKYNVLFERYLPSNHNCDKQNWWNGIYISVISKN